MKGGKNFQFLKEELDWTAKNDNLFFQHSNVIWIPCLSFSGTWQKIGYSEAFSAPWSMTLLIQLTTVQAFFLDRSYKN